MHANEGALQMRINRETCAYTQIMCCIVLFMVFRSTMVAEEKLLNTDFGKTLRPEWIVTDKSGWKLEQGVFPSGGNSNAGGINLSVGRDDWSDYMPYGLGKLRFDFYKNSVAFSNIEGHGEKASPSKASMNWLKVDDDKVKAMENMLSEENRGLSRPVSDRKFWERYPVNEWVREKAEEWLVAKIPVINQDMAYDGKANLDLSRGICAMTIMEAKENRGRFIPQLANFINEWTGQKHWGGAWKEIGHSFCIDLCSARQIRDLAEVWWILGEKLPPASRIAIERGINTWCFEPMRKIYCAQSFTEVQGGGWLIATTNWNPFCQIGVLNAADIFLSRHERAIFYVNAIASLQYYYNAFSQDGYITEGASYYAMGFSRFLDCAEVIGRGTAGKINILPNNGKTSNIFLYPARFSLDRNLYPHFADCGTDGLPQNDVPSYFLAQIDCRSGKNNYEQYWANGWESGHGAFLCEDIGRTLLAQKMLEKTNSQNFTKDNIALTTFFQEPQVVVCRDYDQISDRFAFAAKGGTNHEDHNHNDIGSFCLSYNDRIILGDPGYPDCTLEYFTGKRYNWKLASAYGHPVPVINGYLQTAGDFKAKVIDFKENDDVVVFRLDLTSAYSSPADLKQLERTFRFSRTARKLTITDRFEFFKPGNFSGVLISYQRLNTVDNSHIATDDLNIIISAGASVIETTTGQLDQRSKNGKLFPWRLEYRLANKQLKGEVLVDVFLKKLQ